MVGHGWPVAAAAAASRCHCSSWDASIHHIIRHSPCCAKHPSRTSRRYLQSAHSSTASCHSCCMSHVLRPAKFCYALLSLTLLLLVMPVHCTGSEGIGKAVAAGLAAQGMHLVLVSRSQAKLDAAAQDIQQHWPHIEVRLMYFIPVRCRRPTTTLVLDVVSWAARLLSSGPEATEPVHGSFASVMQIPCTTASSV
jgi:hypothetical protein